MKKANAIKEIVKPIAYGMYEDTYTVYYENGIKRKYTTRKLIAKHLNFMMNAECEKIENHDGKHVGDRYIKWGI